MGKELMKKTILPMLFLSAWAWIAYYFCVSLGQTEWWKIWMVVGMPFGIHRMCIWLFPKNFDIGGTAGVWAMNIIAGCLIGEVVIVWYILRAVYILIKYFVSLLIFNN